MEEANSTLLINWTIDNFSCWNEEIHGTVISSDGFHWGRAGNSKFELHPRGLSGREERLVARLHACKFKQLKEWSVLGSDGSLLHTREVNWKEARGDVLELSPGLSFPDVVDRIRKKEPLHKDRLILSFRVEKYEGEMNLIYHMHSMIDAFETSVKIHFPLKLNERMSGGYQCIKYFTNNSIMEMMLLIIDTNATDSVKIELRVPTNYFQKKVAVRSRLSLVKCEDSVVRSEDHDHVFRDSEPWLLSDSLKREEVLEKGYFVIINLKFMPSTSHKFLSVHTSSSFEILPTEITPSPGVVEDTISNQPANSSVDVLSKELMCLLQDQDLTDFELKCHQNFRFSVHRAILVARCPFFKNMLSFEVVRESGSLNIPDLDVPTLSRFLTFLYTGTVQDLQDEIAFKLYRAADKYQVPSLKKECVDFLKTNVSVSNVCDILSFAKKYHYEQLTSVPHAFILKNFEEVLGSEEWQSFMKTEPLLAVETLTKFATSKKISANGGTSY